MTDTAYQSNNATFFHGSMSTFDATDLPGDPMGQGPYGRASNWPEDGCHFLEGTVSARYPMSYEYGRFQPWVTGPKGQNFAECDNYASYNNVGYHGQIWPASFATPDFTLWHANKSSGEQKKTRIPGIRKLRGVAPKRYQHFTDMDIVMVAVMAFVVVCIVAYMASLGTFHPPPGTIFF